MIEDFIRPAYMAGYVSFIVLFCFSLVMIQKHKPSLIKTAAIQRAQQDRPTTLQWTTIMTIVMASGSVAAGISVLANVIIFVIWGEWSFEPLTIIGLAVAFGIFVFREYDAFMTSLFEKK